MEISSVEKAKEILARVSSEHEVFDNSLTYARLSSSDFIGRIGVLEANGPQGGRFDVFATLARHTVAEL